jgi:ABC-type transporter Mla subunit MlaD
MGRLWRRKWLLIGATIVVFLSVGAVAWAATGGGDDTSEVTVDDCDCGVAAGLALATAGAGEEVGPGAAVREVMRERMQHLRGLKAKLLEELREEMTAADQALYDQLTATLKEQREALQELRQQMKETLGQLRELGKKYLPPKADTAD